MKLTVFEKMEVLNLSFFKTEMSEQKKHIRGQT